MINVKVTFRHGSQSSTTTQAGLQVVGKTESAVVAAIRKRYPTFNNIILVKVE
jgi:hypothetical protein